MIGANLEPFDLEIERRLSRKSLQQPYLGLMKNVEDQHDILIPISLGLHSTISGCRFNHPSIDSHQ